MCVSNVITENLVNSTEEKPKSKPNQLKENAKEHREDILATFTYFTKIFFIGCSSFYKTVQNSLYYKMLLHTTQPAHVITVLAVIIVCLMLIPSEKKSLESPLWALLYLGSFSAHFGAQLWMTFVSGLSLYFALPRHSFGAVQKCLFPKYFLCNSILSLMTLYVFLRAHNYHLGSIEIACQVAAMTICFLIELTIRLYMTPPLLKLMTIKNRIEAQAGTGTEVGKLAVGELLNCPHYMGIYKAFRKVHMTIAIGNIITMACTMFHLYFLSQKICML